MGSVLEELSAAVKGAAENVGPSVVGVGAGGSGVVVSSGVVVTNAHNLRGEETVVTFADGRRAPGRATGVDIDGDLAVLAVETAGAPAVAWSTSPARIGDAVLGLANPGGRGLRASVGFVSAVEVSFRGPGGRKVSGALEHTAPLARGSSGGPLVDSDGKLVGSTPTGSVTASIWPCRPTRS
jgi:S1-C subfamily serine protease